MDKAKCSPACSVEGCGKKVIARGWCSAHWCRWRRHGDPDEGRQPLGDKCSVDWCDRRPRSRHASGGEFCAMHYLQLHQKGEILDPQPGLEPDRKCCVEGCAGGVRSPRAKYCEMHYARQRRGRQLIRTCVVCHAECQGKSPSGMDRRVCSDECEAERLKTRLRATYSRVMATSEGRDRLRQNYSRRRALKLSAFVEDVRWSEVMERGKWVCHLCGDNIPKDAKYPNPKFGTVDHVLPLSMGGQHSYANCKPAHLTCNCRKGAKPLGQLGLPMVDTA